MRVLHVLDKISVDSGVSSVVMNYYGRLEHSNITFDFMLNEDVDAKTRAYIEGNGSKIYVMPELKVRNLFKYIKDLKYFYKNHDYKIIHGHVANSAFFYLGLAKDVPYKIMHSHSIKSSDIFWKRIRNWFLTRFIKKNANSYIACSEEAAEFLFGSLNNVMILNNAVDTDKFIFSEEKRKEIRSSLKLGDEFVIGHAGRFSAVKNHGFLIDIFNEVYRSNKKNRLILLGSGELYDDTVKKVKAFGLEEAVIFVGVTNDVGAYMSAMDIFVLPSLFEGLGLVGVEAQASGLRVLASDKVPWLMNVTGNAEFIRLDKNIWVQKLANAKTDCGRHGQDSKVKGSQFDINTQCRRLYDYYKNLLKKQE
jgi:glycosyltransferase involved in cell wall biosynthesis